jgi:hypothetical protein
MSTTIAPPSSALPGTASLVAAGKKYESRIPGFNTLMVGGTGCGKTYSLGTLVEMGLNVRVLFTEPGMETISQYWQDRKKELPPNVHWHYVAPAGPDWADMIDSANKINKLDLKTLSGMGDINKGKYREFIEILTALSNFKSDRDGSVLGPVDSWGTDTVLVVDSLSGLNVAAMNMVTGSKPVKAIADWGMAMDNLERLITKLCTDTRCHFILTAHLERESDEITGGTQLMASTLGKKLGPKLPRFFSDVIQAVREGDKFYWTTASTNVDLKARNLPIASKLAPDFLQIMESWKKNGGVIEA